jgi:hypothetical protein
MSIKGKGGKQRGYSVVEDRDVTLAKALMFVVKRAIQKEETEEGDDGEYLVADPEGWVSVADVVCPPPSTLVSKSTTDSWLCHTARPLPNLNLGGHIGRHPADRRDRNQGAV